MPKMMFQNLPSAAQGLAVTPSDSATFGLGATRGLWIGATGAVAVKWPNGTTSVLAAVPVGFLPVSVIGVMATGTVATSIIALW